MDEHVLVPYDAQAWATWRRHLGEHAAVLRSVLPRDEGGAALDDTARQYATHLMTDTGVMEAQILEVDTGTVDFAIDTVTWSAPTGLDRVWPTSSAAGAPAPHGWIALEQTGAAAVVADELEEIATRLPLSDHHAAMLDDSLAALRRAARDLDNGGRGHLIPVPAPPAPARAQEDWATMAIASRLLGAVAAVNATDPSVEIAEPYVEMRMRDRDDAFEIRYRLGYPELTGAGSVVADAAGMPALAVALYRGGRAMSEHAAARHGLGTDELQQMALDAMRDSRWWISADPGFHDLVHRVWDLCQATGAQVALSWKVDGAWALEMPAGGVAEGVGLRELELELDRRRALASR